MILEKQKIRDEMLKRRNELPQEFILNSSEVVFDKVYPLLKNSRCVMVFLTFGSELHTNDFIEKLLSDGKKVCVPKCGKNIQMDAIEFDRNVTFSKNKFGIFEPCGAKVIDVESIDALIIPALAVDKYGNRIGFGKGYYDIFLKRTKKTAKKIATVFDFQIIDRIETETFDVPVDFVISEKQTIALGDVN